MDINDAIVFLQNNQPLPDDALLDEVTINKYDDIRKFFIEHPDARCIPLFLNSFGNGNGLGVYQLIEDVIRQFSTNEVVPFIRDALTSNNPSVRYWNAQIAVNFPSEALIVPLSKLLQDSNRDIRYASITALEQIGGDTVKDYLAVAINSEKDEEIVELLADVLSELS